MGAVRSQLVINDGHTDDHITGSILTNTADQTILTTIPYDEGWTVKVDGKAIEYYKTLDSLITFDIEEIGSHEIEFIYRSKAFVYGAACSVFFVVLFAILIVFEKPIYKFIYAKLYDENDGAASDDDVDPDAIAEDLLEFEKSQEDQISPSENFGGDEN